MPYETHFEPHGAYKRFRGVVTGEDVVKSSLEVQSHPEYDRLRYTINDLSDATAFEVAESDLETLAVHNLGAMRTNAALRIAVVSKDERVANAVRLLTTGSYTSHTMRVFGSVEDARHWIEAD